jgi:uroporphyrinogen-III decarboxylase
MNSKSQDLEFDPSKLNYIYNNIKQVKIDKDDNIPLIGFLWWSTYSFLVYVQI